MLASNGDDDKPKILSSHIVEVVDAPIWGDQVKETLGAMVEAAYMRLSTRAANENSLILGVVQAVSTYTLSGERAYALVVLTAQRIGRDDFERQQRAAQLSMGGPRR